MPEPAWAGNGHEENAVMQGFLGLADAWVLRATDARGIAWFRGAVVEVAHAASDRALGVAIGLAPRRLGKAGLSLGADDLAQAEALREGFDPGDWSADQLARIALMVASYRDQASFTVPSSFRSPGCLADAAAPCATGYGIKIGSAFGRTPAWNGD